MGYNPQESLENTINTTVRGTPNCPLNVGKSSSPTE